MQQWKCQRGFTGPFFVTIEILEAFSWTVLCSNGNVSRPLETVLLSMPWDSFRKLHSQETNTWRA